jgi:hypothetical protein
MSESFPGVPGLEELTRRANELYRGDTAGAVPSPVRPVSPTPVRTYPVVPHRLDVRPEGPSTSYYFLDGVGGPTAASRAAGAARGAL